MMMMVMMMMMMMIRSVGIPCAHHDDDDNDEEQEDEEADDRKHAGAGDGAEELGGAVLGLRACCPGGTLWLGKERVLRSLKEFG